MSISILLEEMALTKKLLDSQCISTEAGLEAVNPDKFMGYLVKLTEQSRAIFNKVVKDNNDVVVRWVNKDDFKLHKDITEKPFTLVSANLVFKPVGFSAYLSEFMEHLTEQVDDVMDVDAGILDANKLLATYIGNPEELNKLDVRTIPALDRIEERISDFAEYFKGKDGVDVDNMINLYKSYSDYNSVSSDIGDLTLKLKDSNLSTLESNVDNLYQTLDVFTKVLEDKTIAISKDVASVIGGMIYNLADWVAYYSLFITKLLSVIKAHRDTAVKLNSL